MSLALDDLISRQQDLYTRIANSVDNLKKRGAASITIGAVEARLQLIDSQWQKFESNHDQILSLVTEAHRKLNYFQNDVFGASEEVYAHQKGTLLDIRNGLKAAQPSVSTPSAPRMEDSRPRSSLPRIQLPQFSGKYADWPAFRDLFSSLIIREPALTNVERLHYLKSSLTGDAAALLRNVAVTEANFLPAWETLKGRYENKRLLVGSYISTLTSLSPMGGESAAELKRLLNNTCDAVSALQTLECPVDNGTYWLAHLTAERLDKRSRRDWETSLGSKTEPPTFEDLRNFLETRLRALEAIEQSRGPSEAPLAARTGRIRAAKSHHATKAEKSAGRCALCQRNHYVLFCSSYQGKSPAQRKAFVDSAGICVNCLGKHRLSECQSSKTCQRCSAKHHTSLHEVLAESSTSVVGNAETSSSSISPTSHLAQASPGLSTAVLLATARVVISSDSGAKIKARALIDPCSEVSLISESAAQRLRLPRETASLPVLGVGSKVAHTTRGKVTCSVASSHARMQRIRVAAFVLPRLSAYRPRCSAVTAVWSHLQGLTLADPQYEAADSIDLLLGADVYSSLLLPGLRKGTLNSPVAQETVFGWILSGVVSASAVQEPEITAHQCSVDTILHEQVQRFWVQEEVSNSVSMLTDEERACEEHFVATHSRLLDGRYVVRIPLRRSPGDLGESRTAAVRTLSSVERRFRRDPAFGELYRQFVAEYLDLGHMQPCAPAFQGPVFYLPHHGVLRDGNRLRVVFNGSQPTSTGVSVNDLQYVGPKLLRELPDLLLRWRTYQFAFTADIEKMYRQIRVHEDDWNLQRIVWREGPETPPRDFHLTTVTYGMASAPFLALRTLQQLAVDESQHFPRASRVLASEVYMDDILSGAASVDQASQLAGELLELCRAGGFPLRKWVSNADEVIASLPGEVADPLVLEWPQSLGRSVLGLEWRPAEDCFKYRLSSCQTPSVVTKRSVLSMIARLFDPLGWLAPLTVRAKIFMQSLWLLKTGWDDPLSPREQAVWDSFRTDLTAVSEFSVPRWLGMQPEASVQIVGFSDASERAYAAVVYLRCEDPRHRITVLLVAAKTKVAPVKQLALPRLELCGAALLVRLVRFVRTSLDLLQVPAFLYTDSTVVLGWLRSHPSRWKTFVANRVAEIQSQEPAAVWDHVTSEDNPADCASRGINAARLLRHQLWWTGPSWLSATPRAPASPKPPTQSEIHLEERVVVHAVSRVDEAEDPMLRRFSSLQRLLRVTAWCLRWRQLPQRAIQLEPRQSAILLPRELELARNHWVRHVQGRHFAPEVTSLHKGDALPSRSPLLRLTPFLDELGILRVGGRLKHALLAYEERHPIILPARSHLTYLIVDAVHRRTLHGGNQLTLATLRRSFWVLRGRQVVRSVIHRCLSCLRWRAAVPRQIMAPLPPARVRPVRPFLNSGVDYAGPVFVRASPGRGHKAYKGYISIFVCLATRAVHIEAVSSYSTEAFLAAYRRFTSRRGLCATLYSDCGTTFTGADAELRALFRAAGASSRSIASILANDGTVWKFNPPAAPHFGGIWEAAVKSTKHHLRRVIGDTTLTFEELSTLLSQVEACLNSRPLQPLSDDPEDLAALTPGHFLVGTALTAVPEPSLEDINVPRLSRWQLTQQLLHSFWRRWASEYLTALHERPKWRRELPEVRVGELCLLRNELLPPSKWPLARVVAVHPGEDGHVRVVTLRTAASTALTRPISKIVRLPVAEEDQEDR